MNWERDAVYKNEYICTKYFNGYKYIVIITVENKSKSTLFWVATSSGKKRSQIEEFENKKDKSFGGMKALLWVKEAMLSFPNYFKNIYEVDDIKTYICISWTDSRRRDIYERLSRDGFNFMQVDGKKTLVKKV